MTAATTAAGPVEEHVAALSAALHGPARAKERLVEELRGGLEDTVAAYEGRGVPYERAAELAVREFGSVAELAPGCQRELTIAQVRHTARAVALTIPLLIGCWLLVRTAGHQQQWQLWAAAAAALPGAGTLAATGALARRLPVPDRLPIAVAWAGTVTALAMAVATLGLAGTAALYGNWPLTVLAGALTAASHALVAGSARACRRCARLPAR
ncbi:permease prefix domain 1-containing protein [Spirillospora sp. NPDC029432]|uniref:permease prefix domain 1-containing protein n=1 Tax=Spirillospora sp. NPDC029432 TaxID=3154599 RepID=UPI003452F27D